LAEITKYDTISKDPRVLSFLNISAKDKPYVRVSGNYKPFNNNISTVIFHRQTDLIQNLTRVIRKLTLFLTVVLECLNLNDYTRGNY
jgi:hypothetical protein